MTRTYVGRTLAHIDGATPSSGTYSYYTHDHLASSRGLYDGSKNLAASYEYSPYGDPYSFAAASGATTRLYTGHDFDSVTGMYFSPFRYYGPAMGRWLSRDPLGIAFGPNTYSNVNNNPVNFIDPLGLYCASDVAGVGLMVGGLVLGTLGGMAIAAPTGAVLGVGAAGWFVAGAVVEVVGAFSLFGFGDDANDGADASGARDLGESYTDRLDDLSAPEARNDLDDAPLSAPPGQGSGNIPSDSGGLKWC